MVAVEVLEGQWFTKVVELEVVVAFGVQAVELVVDVAQGEQAMEVEVDILWVSMKVAAVIMRGRRSRHRCGNADVDALGGIAMVQKLAEEDAVAEEAVGEKAVA